MSITKGNVIFVNEKNWKWYSIYVFVELLQCGVMFVDLKWIHVVWIVEMELYLENVDVNCSKCGTVVMKINSPK